MTGRPAPAVTTGRMRLYLVKVRHGMFIKTGLPAPLGAGRPKEGEEGP